jgi:hypothetical protein
VEWDHTKDLKEEEVDEEEEHPEAEHEKKYLHVPPVRKNRIMEQ